MFYKKLKQKLIYFISTKNQLFKIYMDEKQIKIYGLVLRFNTSVRHKLKIDDYI